MESQIYVECSANLITLLEDDMVIVNWRKALDDRRCPTIELVLPAIQNEILEWRANWRRMPNEDVFQSLHDKHCPLIVGQEEVLR